MKTIKIYISSRSNNLSKGLNKVIKLRDLRLHIKKVIENEILFGKQIFEVFIHENNFAPDGLENSHTKSISKLKTSDIIIILYNGEAGWNASSHGTGICHDEYLTATQYFAPMMHILDISTIFGNTNKKKMSVKDRLFVDNIEADNLIREVIEATSVEELFNTVADHIKTLILSDVEKSFKAQKDVGKKSEVFGNTLKYSQMSYEERRSKMSDALKSTIPSIFPGIITNLDVIPDNMSIADARILIGRPFLHELHFIQNKNDKYGVIHVIAVYGNATETQVKDLVGFPDLAVVKTVFGFYLRDKTNQIQMFFLLKNQNAQAIGLNSNALKLWIDSSGERDKIVLRAKARFKILQAIAKAKKEIDK